MLNSISTAPVKTKVILVTTAMLSFISFWRAGAIVLCDLGSSAFYSGAIAEKAVGEAAPWFILAIMLFANLVRMVYVESCSMFVRGGVYKVVKKAMGGTLAKFAVSALVFDYVLTGPISAVSAGQYLVGFINELLEYFHYSFQIPSLFGSLFIAGSIILYFWRKNIIGIEESSEQALRIFLVTCVVGAILLGFSLYTIYVQQPSLPSFEVKVSEESLGWLTHFDTLRHLTAVAILIGLGHSLLAMSGEESLAQVYREVEAPKLKNLKKTAILIGSFAFIFTAVLTFCSVMLIPDDLRITQYGENLLGGLAMHVAGPFPVRMVLHGAVVIVGFLLLSGAVNTSMLGCNGVLCRVSEDGVLSDWFRKPHSRYGTNYRLLYMILFLQLFTLIASRGNMYKLGEAYSFGVVWSFTLLSLAMLILRFKDPAPRDWRVPLNIKIGKVEIPLGLAFVFLCLFTMAIVNLLSKPLATQWGIVFTSAFFILFTMSEKTRKKTAHLKIENAGGPTFQEQVNLSLQESVSAANCGLRKSKRLLITARDPNNLYHVQQVLHDLDNTTTDCVVMAAKVEKPYQIESGSTELFPEEQSLLTQIVNLAEKAGKKVTPLLVPTKNPYYAIVKVAYDLEVEEVVMGLSGKMSVESQMETLAIAWGGIEGSQDRNIRFRAVWPGREFVYEI